MLTITFHDFSFFLKIFFESILLELSFFLFFLFFYCCYRYCCYCRCCYYCYYYCFSCWFNVFVAFAIFVFVRLNFRVIKAFVRSMSQFYAIEKNALFDFFCDIKICDNEICNKKNAIFLLFLFFLLSLSLSLLLSLLLLSLLLLFLLLTQRFCYFCNFLSLYVWVFELLKYSFAQCLNFMQSKKIHCLIFFVI